MIRLLSLLILMILTPLYTPSPAIAEIESNLLLKARKFAQVDANQKLRLVIGNVSLNPALKARDYFNEKPEMQTEFEQFLLNAEQLGETRINERADGFIAAEVDMRITFLSFKQFMSKMQFYRGPGKMPPDLSGLSAMEPQDFVVTGQAVINRSSTGSYQTRQKSDDTAQSALPTAQSPIAGIAGWEYITTEGRLKTEQAALSDARRKLAESIEALPVTDTLSVSDLTAESAVVRAQLMAFIQGLSPFSPNRYYEGGVVEVDLSSPIQNVIITLEKARISEIQTDETVQHAEVFRTPLMRMLEWIDTDTLSVTGSASANSADYVEQSGSVIASQSHLPPWVYRSLEASGFGISQPGHSGREGRANAIFNAHTNARFALVEKAYALKIDKETTVSDFINQSEENKNAVGLFLGAMKLASEPEFLDDGSVKVTVTIELEKLWHIVNQEKKGVHYEN